MDSHLYYECHITIEPVFDRRLAMFQSLCLAHGFKAADLLMKKRAADTEERSKSDTFATGRNTNYEALLLDMVELIKDLHSEGFKVWRYKIEDTVLDSRHGIAISGLDRFMEVPRCVNAGPKV